MADPLWTDIDAVKNNEVYLMPTSLVSYDRFAVIACSDTRSNDIPEVLHYHTYDPSFSKSKDGKGRRSKAMKLTKSMKKHFRKYFKGAII